MTNEELRDWSAALDRHHDLINIAIHEWLSDLEQRASALEGVEHQPIDGLARGRLLELDRRIKALEGRTAQ